MRPDAAHSPDLLSLPAFVASGMLLAMGGPHGTWRAALAELSLAFAGMLLGVVVVIVLTGIGLAPRDSAFGRSLGFIGGPVIMATAALFYRWASRRMDETSRDGRVVEPSKASIGSTLAVIGAGVLAALLGSLGLGLLMETLGFPVAEQVGILEIIERARAGEATVELAVLTVAAIGLAPIAEEWLFRGLLFRRLRAISGNAPAYVLSALGFAAIHWNPAGFVVYLWLGIVFAAVMHRSDRLWAPILVHMGNNAYALTLLIYFPSPTTG